MDISGLEIKETRNKYAAVSNYLALYPVSFQKMEQVKLFFLFLTQINYASGGNSNYIALYHEDVIKALGVNRTSANRSFYIRTALEQMRKDCISSWTDIENGDMYRELPVIGEKGAETGISYIELNKTMLEQHLEGFFERKVLYHKIWVNDVFAMGNRSMMTFRMYMKLITSADRKKESNRIFFTTKQLKELFGLSKEKYVDAGGHFKRTDFENKTLGKVLGEIAEKCEAVELIPQSEDPKTGKIYFEKVKKGAAVAGYAIRYRIREMLSVISDTAQSLSYEDTSYLTWIDNETENEFTVDELKRIDALMMTVPEEKLPEMNAEILSREMQKSAYLRKAYLKMRHYAPAQTKRCGYLCRIIETDIQKKDKETDKKGNGNSFLDFDQHDYDLKELAKRAKMD